MNARTMTLRLGLFGLSMGCATGKGPSTLREARPMVGDPGATAAPGQSACEAATPAWPSLPELDAHIERQMERGHLPGLAACIVKEGDVVWCGAYGQTRVDGGQAVSTDTPFLWASVSKLVTATAAGMLAEQGLLDLDRAVDIGTATVIHPDAPDEALSTRALLAHVGGVRDNDDAIDGYEARDHDPALSLEEVADRYFLPGGADYDASANFLGGGPTRRGVYSNMGYALVGRGVEVAAGADLADWSADHIFAPLGMRNTSWRLSDFSPDSLAEPSPWRRGGYDPSGHATYADYPNGGLRSSAHDMACFLAMAARGGVLYGTRLLETDTLHQMMAPAYPSLDEDQGLGWYYEDMGDAKLWVGHSGGEEGVAADAFLRQNGRLGIVVVANGDWGSEDPILTIEDELVIASREL